MLCPFQQTFLGATELDDELIKQLPKEVLLRVFSYLDVVSLCRCAQVNELAQVKRPFGCSVFIFPPY